MSEKSNEKKKFYDVVQKQDKSVYVQLIYIAVTGVRKMLFILGTEEFFCENE